MSELKQIAYKIFGMETVWNIRNFIKLHFSKKKLDFISKAESRVFFLDAADYGNIGDIAIRESIISFFENEYGISPIVINSENFSSYYKFLKSEISSNDLIVLSGGGNMGILYPKYEALRRFIIKHFQNIKIIVFPSTITYGHDNFSKRELKKSINIYSKENIVILARERVSYDFIKSYYNCCCYIVPDIVFYLKKIYPNLKKYGVKGTGVCFRNDKENFNVNLKNSILNYIGTYGELTTLENNDIMDYRAAVYNKLNEFSEYDLIITDRLHGLIFSYIVGARCIALDNSNGKVLGIYKWLENEPNIQFVSNYAEFIDAFLKKNDSNSTATFNNEFNELKEIIDKQTNNLFVKDNYGNNKTFY